MHQAYKNKDLPGVGFVVTGTGLVGVTFPKTDKAAFSYEKEQELQSHKEYRKFLVSEKKRDVKFLTTVLPI